MQELEYKARDGKLIKVLFYASKKPNAPLIYEIHGGGYISGKASDDRELCQLLGEKTGANVASVEYRYAPEVTFPKATEDCEDALRALILDKAVDFDREKIALIGHSAGANAVAVLCITMSDIGIKAAVLDYPWLNVYKPKRPYILFGYPNFYMRRLDKKYFPKGVQAEPLASLVRISEEQAELFPPTFILTAEKDTLRVDGLAFRDKLKMANIAVEWKEYRYAVHGFIETGANGTYTRNFWMSKKRLARQLRLCYEAIDDIAKYLNDILD